VFKSERTVTPDIDGNNYSQLKLS